jgi:hypothetical protein
MIALFACGTIAIDAEAAGDVAECLAGRLKELQPLPKVHYSWPLPAFILTASNPALSEFARVTHAMSIRGESATAEQIAAMVWASKQAPEWAPGGKPSIAINYSPWHRRFGPSLPATDMGDSAREESAVFRQRLAMIRDDVAEANKKYAASASVSAILLDCERFATSAKDETLNKAITSKQDQIYEIAKDIFPSARVEWYGRGAVHASSDAKGWAQSRYFTLREKGDSFSCSLYQLPEESKMREAYRRTVELARSRGVMEVTPWIALGAGWKQRDSKTTWEFNWDYDLKYSWQLGADINNVGRGGEAGEPWAASKVVVLYPCPLDERSPGSFEHFVAYVRGATGQPESDHHRMPACRREVSKLGRSWRLFGGVRVATT